MINKNKFLIFILGSLLIWNIDLSKSHLQEGLIAAEYLLTGIMPTYKERLCFKVGKPLCSFYDLIIKNTAENSSILIPPQANPWPETGNIAYSRYFLYPRKIVNGNEKDSKVDLNTSKIQYVLIDWGGGIYEYGHTNGWPKFPLPAKKIYLENGKTINTDYHPQDIIYIGQRGLIQLDRERL